METAKNAFDRQAFETANCTNYNLLKQFALHMRNNMTDAERHLWYYLQRDSLGVRFRCQHIIGDFIGDFVCLKAKLVVEIDGGYHSLPEQEVSDTERTELLNSRGFHVMRFTNEEVLYKTGQVLSAIENYISSKLSDE